MVLVVTGIGLLAVMIVSAVYSASSRQTMHRRRIARRLLLLTLAVLIAVDGMMKTPGHRWINIGLAVFVVGAVVGQTVWDQRRTPL